VFGAVATARSETRSTVTPSGTNTIPYLTAEDVPYHMNKDEVLTTISLILLLFSAIITWNIYSWLILVAIFLILLAWYFKK